RDIGFAQVRGFDALAATQDVPVGFQLGTMFGRSLSVLGSRDDDIFLAGDLYVGVASSWAASRVPLQAEGRRRNDHDQWDGVLTSGQAAQSFKLSSTPTFIASTAFG